MDNHITGFSIRRERRDEFLCMETPGGVVYLSRRALEAAGDSWDRLRALARSEARRKQLPFADETE